MNSVYIEYGNQYEYNGTNIEIAMGGYMVFIFLKDWSNPRNRVWTKKQCKDLEEFMQLSDKKKRKYLRK